MSLLKRLMVTSFCILATNSITAAPCWNWTGFYGGVNLGVVRFYDKLQLTPKGLWGTESQALQDFIAGNGTTRLSEWNVIAGGQVGFNYQICSWLYGVEIDGNYLNLADHRRTATLLFDGLPSYSFHERVEHRWLATARARLGIVFKTRFMTYLTGGYATGDIKVSSKLFGVQEVGVIGNYQSFASASKVLHGWTAGGGIEYALRPHFTIRGEYLYVHLGHFNTTSHSNIAGFFEEREYKISQDIIRFALNYRL